MNNIMKLDLKILITIGGIIAVLGGFYFTTQLRLDSLEEKIEKISSEIHEKHHEIEKQIARLKRAKHKGK